MKRGCVAKVRHSSDRLERIKSRKVPSLKDRVEENAFENANGILLNFFVSSEIGVPNRVEGLVLLEGGLSSGSISMPTIPTVVGNALVMEKLTVFIEDILLDSGQKARQSVACIERWIRNPMEEGFISRGDVFPIKLRNKNRCR